MGWQKKIKINMRTCIFLMREQILEILKLILVVIFGIKRAPARFKPSSKAVLVNYPLVHFCLLVHLAQAI